jgi:hypothetical protein
MSVERGVYVFPTYCMVLMNTCMVCNNNSSKMHSFSNADLSYTQPFPSPMWVFCKAPSPCHTFCEASRNSFYLQKDVLLSNQYRVVGLRKILNLPRTDGTITRVQIGVDGDFEYICGIENEDENAQKGSLTLALHVSFGSIDRNQRLHKVLKWSELKSYNPLLKHIVFKFDDEPRGCGKGLSSRMLAEMLNCGYRVVK